MRAMVRLMMACALVSAGAGCGGGVSENNPSGKDAGQGADGGANATDGGSSQGDGGANATDGGSSQGDGGQQGTPPSAPTALTATAASGQVTLQWLPATGAASYNLYWSSSTGVSKARGNKLSNANNPFVHSGLTNGIAYYYVVTAVNAGGESAESAEASATPEPLPTITGFTPAQGAIVGTAVTISGTNFDPTPANNVVKFNGTAAVVSAATRTDLQVTVPAGATTGPLTVTTPGAGTATAPTDFRVFLLDEGFEGNGTPTGWNLVDNIGNWDVWLFGSSRGNTTGGTGRYAMVDGNGSSGSTCTAGQDTELISPKLDLTGLAKVTLELKTDLDPGGDVASIDVRVGGTRNNIYRRTTMVAGPKTLTFDITPEAAHKANVSIILGYVAPNCSMSFWKVDDVRVY